MGKLKATLITLMLIFGTFEYVLAQLNTYCNGCVVGVFAYFESWEYCTTVNYYMLYCEPIAGYAYYQVFMEGVLIESGYSNGNPSCDICPI